MKCAFWMLLSLGVMASAATNRVFRVHPLLFADPPLVLEQAQALVGNDGKVTLDAAQNRLLVMATEEQHRQIADLIQQVSVPPKNIQIEVRINDATSGAVRGAGATVIRGGVLVGGGVHAQGGVRVMGQDSSIQSSRESVQFLTVSSGRRGVIVVSEEAPFVDWFLAYGVRWGYLQAGIQWRQVGARLLVEPRVVGEGHLIHVKLIPELSYFLDNKRCEVAFINAATELTVADGQEFRVGGTEQNREFMSKFLVGYDSARQHRAVDIVLRATILP